MCVVSEVCKDVRGQSNFKLNVAGAFFIFETRYNHKLKAMTEVNIKKNAPLRSIILIMS